MCQRFGDLFLLGLAFSIHRFRQNMIKVKSSQNKKDLNDVTAALFLMSFSQLPTAKKHRKQGSCDVNLGPSYFVTTLDTI